MRHTCCGRSRWARAGLRPAVRPGPASEEHNGRRLRGWAVGVGVLGGTDGETLPCDSVPLAGHSRTRLRSACGPRAASDRPPLLAAQHPGGIAIARNGRTRSRPLRHHRAAPFSECQVLHANRFIEAY
ncbi:unnamed protein product [Coccothraustes coccothraustes]